MKIPLSRPDISEYDKKLVLETLDTPHLSQGLRVKEFEKAFASFLGTEHAVAVNSGTSALHLCVKSLGIKDGDLVATTPFSFVASANCLLFERARPVFVDIDPDTLNLDVNKLEETIRRCRDMGTPLKGLLPVHIFGRPCDMKAIMGLAESYGLPVLEDACEALGAELNFQNSRGIEGEWRKAGTIGDCSAFGFYPNKQITTGEGGVIATDSEAIARMCRSLRNQGRGEPGNWLQHERLGYSYRLSDIICALGIAQLSRIEEMLAMRDRVARWYEERLETIEDVLCPRARKGERISWFVYVIRLSARFPREARDLLLDDLRERGISCSNYFSPIHLQPFYKEMFGYKEGDFPVTEAVSERTVALPFFNALTETQVEYVFRNLKEALGNMG